MPFAITVGLVGEGATVIAVYAHLAVTMIGVNGATGFVDGDLVVVDAKAVALGIPVGEKAALEHAVRGETDALDNA